MTPGLRLSRMERKKAEMKKAKQGVTISIQTSATYNSCPLRHEDVFLCTDTLPKPSSTQDGDRRLCFQLFLLFLFLFNQCCFLLIFVFPLLYSFVEHFN